MGVLFLLVCLSIAWSIWLGILGSSSTFTSLLTPSPPYIELRHQRASIIHRCFAAAPSKYAHSAFASNMWHNHNNASSMHPSRLLRWLCTERTTRILCPFLFMVMACWFRSKSILIVIAQWGVYAIIHLLFLSI